MIHEILPLGPLACNCSIVGDEQSREAIVIDPGDEIEQVLAILQKHQLVVKQIVITHAHIDHIGGAAKLKRATGAPVLLNVNDEMLLKMLDVQATWCGMRPPENTVIDLSITTGDKVKAGSSVAEVMHFPFRKFSFTSQPKILKIFIQLNIMLEIGLFMLDSSYLGLLVDIVIFK